jgi:hypothetical protein
LLDTVALRRGHGLRIGRVPDLYAQAAALVNSPAGTRWLVGDATGTEPVLCGPEVDLLVTETAQPSGHAARSFREQLPVAVSLAGDLCLRLTLTNDAAYELIMQNGSARRSGPPSR